MTGTPVTTMISTPWTGASGKCEHVCPQHLPIRKLLEDVAKEFETKE